MEVLLTKIGQLNNGTNANYSRVFECVLRTMVDMLRDRGYNIGNDCRTIGDITYKIQENDPILYGDSPEGKIVVFFHNEERVGVKQLRTWYEQYSDSSIIIVSLEGPTAFTKREAEQNYENVQFFTFQSLCINVTKHALVPKHEKLTKSERDQLNYSVSSSEEWPKLYTSDAISQYYNYKPGDLIKITRTIGYPEPVYYYRLVCDPPLS